MCPGDQLEIGWTDLWRAWLLLAGEVSDSDKGSDGDLEVFDDGLDENLIGDEDDKKRLEQMTEKEREQEIFNRLEKRDAMRTRYTHKIVRISSDTEIHYVRNVFAPYGTRGCNAP